MDSGAFGGIFGWGQEAVQRSSLSAGRVLYSREPRPKRARNFLPSFLPLIPPRNEVSVFKFFGFYEAIMVITINLPCAVFKGAIKWRNQAPFSFLIK